MLNLYTILAKSFKNKTLSFQILQVNLGIAACAEQCTDVHFEISSRLHLTALLKYYYLRRFCEFTFA